MNSPLAVVLENTYYLNGIGDLSKYSVCELMMKCCSTSTETVGLLGTGAQDVHLDFHTAPEL